MNDKPIEFFQRELCRGAISRREFMLLASALGIGAAAAASMDSLPALGATPKPGGRIRLATGYGGTTDSLDPTKFANTTDYLRGFMIYSALVALDRKGEPIPLLAESWESNDTLDDWAFMLRKGVTWHNGKDFTSADVLYSYQRHLNEKSESPAKPYLEQVVEMKADGPQVVRMKLSAPNADFPPLFTQPQFMVTQEGQEYLPETMGTAFEKVAGCGPYKVKEFKVGVRSLFVRNENYFGNTYADEFEVVNVLDPTTRINAMMAGEFDVGLEGAYKLGDLLRGGGP